MEDYEIESKIEDYLSSNLNIEIEVENDFGDSYLKVKVNLNNREITSDYVNIKNIIRSV